MAESIHPMSSDNSVVSNARLTMIANLLVRLAAGDFSARAEVAPTGDALDQILVGIDQLAAKLQQQHASIAEAEQRSDELLDVMMSMATGDYTQRAALHDSNSLFDALASGLNMLADEFVAGQQEHARLQEQIIQTQAAAIQELSTPLIPINDDILVMPLIGTIDSARAQHVLERLLDGVATTHTQTVILDITGVAVVDTQVAKVLIQAAQAVQLLGTQMILTGIRPEVAQTLVHLGVELRGIVTWSTMQMGIAYAMRRASQRSVHDRTQLY